MKNRPGLFRRVSSFGTIAAAVALCAGSLQATTLIVSNPNDTDPRFVTSSGDPVPDGTPVRVGYFPTWETDETTIRNGDFTTVNNLFTEVGGMTDDPAGSGTGSVATSDAIAPGRFFGQIANVNNAAPFVPADSRMVLFAGSASQWGVFGAVGAEWFMPSSNLAPLPMNPGAVGSVDAIRGLFTGGGDMALVPEPNAALFIGLVGFGLLVRRRRR